MAVTNFIDRIRIGDSTDEIAIGSSAYGECNTAADTRAKTVNIPGFVLNKGTTIHVKFIYANSASDPTLAVRYGTNTNDITEAKQIMQYGTTPAGSTATTSGWQSNAIVSLTYDGTYWIRDQGYNTNSTYSTMSQAEAWTGTNTNSRAMTAARLKAILTNLGGTGLTLIHNATDGIVLNHTNSITAKENYASAATTASANGGNIILTDIQYDSEGHITSSTDRTITLSVPVTSVNGNTGAVTTTDEKVKQTPTTTNANYELLFSESAYSENTNDTELTEGARKTSALKYNPSTNTLTIGTGTLTATDYDGNAATATNATTHIANTNNPHGVTKAQLDLDNVTNHAQVTSLSYNTTTHKLTYKVSNGNDIEIATFGSLAEDSTDYLPLSGGDMSGHISLVSGNTSISKATNRRIYWKTTTDETTGYIAVSSDGLMGIHATGSLYFRPGKNGALATDTGAIMTKDAFYPYSNTGLTLGTASNGWSSVYATTFIGNLNGNATTATSSKVLANQNGTYGTATTTSNRVTNTNIAHINNGGVTHFKVGTATNGPTGSGNILHFYWDTSDAWDAQLHIPNNSANSMSWRASSAAGTWDNWTTLLDDKNTTAPSTIPILSWGNDSTVFTLNGVAVKIKAMAQPTYAFDDLTTHPTTLGGYGITDATIGNGVITLGSSTITPITSINNHTGSSVTLTAGDLGLSNALHFIGITSTELTDGDTTSTLSPLSNDNDSLSKTTGFIDGDVVIYDSTEFIKIGSKWNAIGDESSWAYRDHTHTASIAKAVSEDTSTLTLAFGTKYKVISGGSEYVFTMPSNPNTNTATRQQVSTTNKNYSLLFSALEVGTATNTSSYSTYRNDSVYVNPSTGIVTANGFVGNVTGTADAATVLETSRTLWGQSFNGSSNITGNLTDVGPDFKLPSNEDDFYFLKSDGTTEANGYFGTVYATTFSGAASNVTTTASTNTFYLVGVKSDATSTLLHDISITASADVLTIGELTITGGSNTTNSSIASSDTLTINNATQALNLQTTSAALTISTQDGNLEAKSTGGGTVKLTGATGAMTISTTSGALNIETSSGDTAIDSGGTISISSASGKTITIDSGSTLYLNKPTTSPIVFTSGGTSNEIARFNTNGKFQLKDSGTQNTHELYVNGDSAFNGKIVFGTQTSNSINENAYMQWNATDQSIDFLFA